MMVMATGAGHDGRVDGYLRYVRRTGLPRYSNPPVSQVSLGFHFQGFSLRAVDFGRMYDSLRDAYPVVEESAPIASPIEQFGGPQAPVLQFQFMDRPPVPMTTLLDERRGRLVQLQSDRFSCAWRKVPGDEMYPDYEELRSQFVLNAMALEQYADSLDAPDLLVVQAEITYINDVPLDGRSGWELARRMLRSGPRPSDASVELPTPDEFKMAQTHTIDNEIGNPSARLHIAAESVWADTGPVYRLALTYRGQPGEHFPGRSDAFDTMLAFFDEGHAKIVTAFTEVTSPEMHRLWGRQP